jgi:plastocyanin
MRSIALIRVLLAVALCTAALAGCGGDDEENGGSAPTTASGTAADDDGRVIAKVLEEVQPGIPAQLGQWMVEIEADPSGKPAYTVKEVVAPAGNTNFEFVNPTSVGHDLTLAEVGGGSIKTPVIRKGSAWRRISLFEGTKYVFYCSVPGHRKAGMEGRIKVDPRLEAADLEAY